MPDSGVLLLHHEDREVCILNRATFHNISAGLSASRSDCLTDVFGNEE